MTDNFVRNRIADIEQIQKSLADEVKDEHQKGPNRMDIAAKAIVYLEFAREALKKGMTQ
jgi:hypothetical protein